MEDNKVPKTLISELQEVLNKYNMLLIALPDGKFDIKTRSEYEKEI